MWLFISGIWLNDLSMVQFIKILWNIFGFIVKKALWSFRLLWIKKNPILKNNTTDINLSFYLIVFIDGLVDCCRIVFLLDVVDDAGELLPYFVDLRCLVHVLAGKQVATSIYALLLAVELEYSPCCTLFLEVFDDWKHVVSLDSCLAEFLVKLKKKGNQSVELGLFDSYVKWWLLLVWNIFLRVRIDSLWSN